MRAISGEKTAFAYSDEISFAALQDAAKATRAIAAAGQAKERVAVRRTPVPLYRDVDPIESLPADAKVALLEKLKGVLRARPAHHPGDGEPRRRIRSGAHRACRRRRFLADVRPLVRLSVQVIAEVNGRRESGSSGGGGRSDYSHFTDEAPRALCLSAVSAGATNLKLAGASPER